MDSQSFSENEPTRARERWPAIKRPGQPGMPVDWGRLTKEGDQWRWPFREMELGDRFYIAAGDVDVKYLRSKAHSYGKGYKFSVKEDWTGALNVERVAQRGTSWDWIKADVARDKVETRYESDDPEIAYMLEADGDHRVMFALLGWQNLEEEGQSVHVPLRLVKELPDRRSYIFQFEALDARYAMELEPDGVTITRVSRDMTQTQWDAQRLQEALS